MNQRLNAWLTYLFLRPFFRGLLKVFFSLEVEGEAILENYPTAILAGNHTGFLDGPIILSSVNRPVLFVMAKGVLNWPIIGWLVRWIGILTIEPTQAKGTLQKATQYLKSRQTVCIFPEGELSKDGEMGKFHSGVTFLHVKSQVPIIPFAIHGGYEAWHWGQWLPKPRKIVLKFGEPIVSIEESRSVLLDRLYNEVQSMKRLLENKNSLPYSPILSEA